MCFKTPVKNFQGLSFKRDQAADIFLDVGF